MLGFRGERRGVTLVAIASLFVLGLSTLPLTTAQAQRERDKPHVREADARKLLRRMVEAEFRQAFLARETTFNREARSGTATEFLIKRDPKRGSRWESIIPPGRISLDNFKRSYVYTAHDNRLTESESQLRQLKATMVQEILKRFPQGGPIQVAIVGQEQVLGRTADIVEVVYSPPAGASRPRPLLGALQRRFGSSRRFWIDRETGLRLKTELMDAEGRVLSGSYYLSLNVKPKFTDEDFLPPQGAKKTDLSEGKTRFKTVEEAKKAGVTVHLPSYLPTGFVLRVIDAGERGGNVTTRYSDGMSFLSLTQLKGPIPPFVRQRFRDKESGAFNFPNGQRAYVRRNGDLTILLISNLPDEELKRIVESVP